MPYDDLSDLPESVRSNLPEHAQESRAHRVAWSVVENKKNDRVQKEN
jgi:cation transport regulator